MTARTSVAVCGVVATVLAVLAVITETSPLKTTLILITGVGLVLTILAFKPQIFIYSASALLGFIPFSSIAIVGFQVPLALVLSVLAIPSALIGRDRKKSRWRGALACVCIVAFVTSAVSFIATRGQFGTADDQEFAKWALAMSPLVFVTVLKRSVFEKCLKVFALGTAGGALFSMAALLIPGGAALLDYLALLGYARSSDNLRYFIVDGAAAAVRLSGPYVDPNIAGLFFFVGAIVAIYVLRGRIRVVSLVILGPALLLSLSRGALLAVAATLLLIVFASRARSGPRIRAASLVVSALLVVMWVPGFSERFLSTFSNRDIGSVDRVSALNLFPTTMSNSWMYGLGWGRPEFRDSAASYATNMVANAPLAVIYRGGMVALSGYAVLVILITVAAILLLRSAGPSSILGAGWIGFLAVAQTGYATVILAPVVCMTAFLSAIVVRAEIEREFGNHANLAIEHDSSLSLSWGHIQTANQP